MVDRQQEKAREEFDAWLTHPVTQQVLAAARLRKETFKERWAAGAFTDLSQYGTAILNAKAIGGCEMLDWLIGLDHETLQGDLSDA